MPILNYTTDVPMSRTIAEIETKLAKCKAAAIMKEYDGAGLPSAICFRIETPHGLMSFRLPANIEKVHAVLQNQKGVDRRFRTTEHAARVGWRIIKVWLDAQVALIETEMANLAQVFLPYAQTGNGETLYERFEKKGLPALTHVKE